MVALLLGIGESSPSRTHASSFPNSHPSDMLTGLFLFSRLSADPSVPLFGEAPYAYGEGEASRVKQPSVAFGQGGSDALCPDCFSDPPGGRSLDGGGATWWIYNDPTWDFSVDEPRHKRA